MTEGTVKQLGFNTIGGYDTGIEQFIDGPVPLSEAEMAEFLRLMNRVIDALKAERTKQQ